MTKILIDEAVVRQALAALELVTWTNNPPVNKAIIALRQALEQPAPAHEPVADDRLALIAHNIDPGDWNDLGFRDSWYRGFRAGFREAENEHNIRMEK